MISKYKRLALALVSNQGVWVRNHQLANQAQLSTRVLGALMKPIIDNKLAERKTYRIHGYNRQLNIEYCCTTSDVDALEECSQIKRQIAVVLDSVVQPEHSESWFTQAARLMGE